MLSACNQNGLPKYLTDWFHWKFGREFFIFDFVIKSINNTSKTIHLCLNGQFLRTGISCQLNKNICAIEKQVTVRLFSSEWYLGIFFSKFTNNFGFILSNLIVFTYNITNEYCLINQDFMVTSSSVLPGNQSHAQHIYYWLFDLVTTKCITILSELFLIM